MTSHTTSVTGTVSGLANNQQVNVISENLAKMVPSGTAPTTASTGFSTLSGIWWHDTTNNQVKVRDQADTTWIVIGTLDETAKTFVAAATGIAAIQGAAKNLKVSTVTGSAVVTADEVVLETTGNVYAVSRSVSVTIATGASGANGLDTGTFAANTWYSVWVIFNGTTTAGLISTSATAPTMPATYTYKARVGWIRSNATPALLGTLQYGRRVQYVVDGTILTSHRQIAAGSVGNPGTPTYTATAWATYAPSTAAGIYCLAIGSSTNGNAVVAPNGNFGSATSTSNPAPIALPQNSLSASAIIIPESSNLYIATEANARVYVTGWEDSL